VLSDEVALAARIYIYINICMYVLTYIYIFSYVQVGRFAIVLLDEVGCLGCS